MYFLKFKSSVKKDFKKLNHADTKFLKDSIITFAENLSSSYEQELMKTGKIKKMQGEDDIYRLRLRSYRVIYKKENDKLIILVLSVKSRENSYKK